MEYLAVVNLPLIVLAAAALWIVTCMSWFAIVLRGWFARRKTTAPRDFPAPFINGIFLLGLAPIVSALQYTATAHQTFWGGSGVLLVGLMLIVLPSVRTRWRTDPSTSSAVMTLREKIIVAQLAAILVVYSYYGVRLWGEPLTPLAATAALIGITIVMILVLIAAHLAVGLNSQPEQPDERDQVIALRGSRNGYATLAVGVWCVLLLAISHTPYGLLFYAIMGAFALAELVRLGSQLFYYRFVA